MASVPPEQHQQLQNELDEIMEANDFMRSECDLFAAFLWRRKQKSSDGNDDDPEDDTADVENKAPQSDIKLTTTEYGLLQKSLQLETRMKMCVSEKYSVKNEIEDLLSKSEKDTETLRAVLEECRLRTAETKKDAYDFRRDIVISSQSEYKGGSREMAGRIKRFIVDKLKDREMLLKKYKTKNHSMQQQIGKLQEQLKISTSQNGDSFHLIDLEQLKIQNAQYSQIILERNKELLKLKMNTGKTVQQLNNHKQELMQLTQGNKVLEKNSTDKQKLVLRLDDELQQVQTEIDKQQKFFDISKQKIQNADIQIIDYVHQKQMLHEVDMKLKSFQRKTEIAEISAKQAQKTLKRHQKKAMAQTV